MLLTENSNIKVLYPEIDNFAADFLNTKSLHSVYYEQAGNKDGIPVVFFHGGPGSGCSEKHRRYFDPDKYRIILFDQRACNRSSPFGLTSENTTKDILDDIELIRKKLNIKKWFLFGGSWGATLALLYAELFPEKVSGILLRGTFLARQTDFDWFVGSGVNRIYPEYWDEFLAFFGNYKQSTFIKKLYSLLFSNDKDIQFKAAYAWSLWAGRIVTSSVFDCYEPDIKDRDKFVNEVKIEIHYAYNNYFIKENQILDNINNIPKVPITIIHGRRDLTCLPESSWLVHKALPDSKLVMVKDAGHLAIENTMIDALICGTDEMVNLLQ